MEDSTDMLHAISRTYQKFSIESYIQTSECYINIMGASSPPSLYIDAREAPTRQEIPLSQINHVVRCTEVQLP